GVSKPCVHSLSTLLDTPTLSVHLVDVKSETTAHLLLHSLCWSSSSCKVLLHFVNQSGMKTSVSAMEGESLLEVVINKNLQIDGFGACEGTLACSTCHLIFEDGVYEKMEPMADEEMDMLDLAYGLTKLSRLGCQVTVERWMDGMTVRVPQEVKDRREKPEAEI
uniref:2Fe-2S ferredoxin-type domain-containing protein n=1 Tax=Pygocentrus nattereri TaxID=42514 RepID=A0A3B4DIJ9_PYGNA